MSIWSSRIVDPGPMTSLMTSARNNLRLQYVATIACICTKFDGETENEAPQDVLKSNLYQVKSKMAGAAILKFS